MPKFYTWTLFFWNGQTFLITASFTILKFLMIASYYLTIHNQNAILYVIKLRKNPFQHNNCHIYTVLLQSSISVSSMRESIIRYLQQKVYAKSHRPLCFDKSLVLFHLQHRTNQLLQPPWSIEQIYNFPNFTHPHDKERCTCQWCSQ